MEGVKKDEVFTQSKVGKTATPPDDDPDHATGVRYVTSMTFPVSKEKSVYFLWLYLNSSVIGAQSGDGKGDAGPNAPNQHSKYEGKFTVDWSTLTKQ